MNTQQCENQNDSKTMEIAKRLEQIESSNKHLKSLEKNIRVKIEHIDDMRSRGDGYLAERIAYNREYLDKRIKYNREYLDKRIEYLKGRIEYNRGYLDERIEYLKGHIEYNREYLDERIEYNRKYLNEQIAYNREHLEKRIEYIKECNENERIYLEEKFNKLNDKVEKGNTLKSKVEFRISVLIILVIGLIVNMLIILL